MLVMIRQDIDKRQGRVGNLASINRIDDAMTRSGADEELALGHDSEFKSRQLHLMPAALLHRPLHVPPFFLKVAGGTLERIEALDEDACENKQPCLSWVGLMEATKDLGGYQLAQGCTSSIHALMG